MTISEIAEKIFEEDINEDSTYSEHFITLWLISNIGQLNNALSKCYVIINSEASPEIGDDEAVIFRQIFMIKYFNDKYISNLGAAANDAVIEIDSDSSRVRLVNKNEIAKSSLTAKKDAEDRLKQMINRYKMAKNAAMQVVGQDVINTEDESLKNNFNRT